MHYRRNAPVGDLFDVVDMPSVNDRLILLAEVQPIEVTGGAVVLEDRSIVGVRSPPLNNDALADSDRLFCNDIRRQIVRRRLTEEFTGPPCDIGFQENLRSAAAVQLLLGGRPCTTQHFLKEFIQRIKILCSSLLRWLKLFNSF
jgi:hypothetical protein